MILSRRTKCYASWFAGVVLLLIATAVLSQAAMVRADDEPNQENVAAQQRALEQDRQKEEQAPEGSHRKAEDKLDKLLKSMNRMLDIERARQGLRNLGFDEKLIETLIKDRAKAKSASELLQNVLRLTGDDQPETKTDDAGKE